MKQIFEEGKSNLDRDFFRKVPDEILGMDLNFQSNREKGIEFQNEDKEEASLENIFCTENEVSVKSDIVQGVPNIYKFNSPRKNKTLDSTGHFNIDNMLLSDQEDIVCKEKHAITMQNRLIDIDKTHEILSQIQIQIQKNQNNPSNIESCISQPSSFDDNLNLNLSNKLDCYDTLKSVNNEMNQFLAKKYLNNLYENILDQFDYLNLKPSTNFNNKIQSESQNDEHFEKIKTISERMQKGIEQLEDKLKKFYENDNLQSKLESQISIANVNLIEDYNTPEFIEEKENISEHRSSIQDHEQSSLALSNEQGVDYFTIGPQNTNNNDNNNNIKNRDLDQEKNNNNSGGMNSIIQKMNSFNNNNSKQDPESPLNDSFRNENLDSFEEKDKNSRQEVKNSSIKFKVNENDQDYKISKGLLFENFSLKEKLKRLKIQVIKKETIIKDQSKQIEEEENSNKLIRDKYIKWKDKFKHAFANNNQYMFENTTQIQANNSKILKRRNLDSLNVIENPNDYIINGNQNFKNSTKIHEIQEIHEINKIQEKNIKIHLELIPNTINIYKGEFYPNNRNSSQFTLSSFERKSDVISNLKKNGALIDNSLNLNNSQKLFQKISSKLSRFCNVSNCPNETIHPKSLYQEKKIQIQRQKKNNSNSKSKSKSKSNLIKPSELYKKISDSYYQLDSLSTLKELLNNDHDHNLNILRQKDKDLSRTYEENDKNILNESFNRKENDSIISIKKNGFNNNNKPLERKSYNLLTRKLRILFNK